jgi:hypothetical protein
MEVSARDQTSRESLRRAMDLGVQWQEHDLGNYPTRLDPGDLWDWFLEEERTAGGFGDGFCRKASLQLSPPVWKRYAERLQQACIRQH